MTQSEQTPSSPNQQVDRPPNSNTRRMRTVAVRAAGLLLAAGAGAAGGLAGSYHETAAMNEKVEKANEQIEELTRQLDQARLGNLESTRIETVIAVNQAERLADDTANQYTKALAEGELVHANLLNGSLIPLDDELSGAGQGGTHPAYVNPIVLSSVKELDDPSDLTGVFIGVVGHDQKGNVTINPQAVDMDIYRFDSNGNSDTTVVGNVALVSEALKGGPGYIQQELRAVDYVTGEPEPYTPGLVTFEP